MGRALTRTYRKNGRLLSSSTSSYFHQTSEDLDISYPDYSFSVNDSRDVVGLDFLSHRDKGKFSIFDLLDPTDPGTDVLLQNAERLTLPKILNTGHERESNLSLLCTCCPGGSFADKAACENDDSWGYVLFISAGDAWSFAGLYL